MSKDKNISIEEGLERLDQILEKMEEKDTELSESFDLYEEGMKLLRNINSQIDEVEKKVMVLTKEGLSEFEAEE